MPDFLQHLPASTCEALMQSADHIDVLEKVKAQSSGGSQSELARKLSSGSSASAGSRSSSRSSSRSASRSASSGSRGSGLAPTRRPRVLQSLSSPEIGTVEAGVACRTSRGSVGEFEIRPHGSAPHRADDSEKKAERRKQRRARQEVLQSLKGADLVTVGLPPILPIAGGSITMTVGASAGKEGTAELVGREAAELADLGGLISPSAIDDFDFSTAFMTPEMMEEKNQRRARLRKVMRTARMTSMMHKSAHDKQQSQALHSFLGGMKSRTRVKSLVNRHVRDENRRLFATTVA
eukprot:COSAG02_NODE_8374_length_2594_cov_1.577956_3_plen_293_part_00